MASDGQEQTKLLQQFHYLTALINKHKEPPLKPERREPQPDYIHKQNRPVVSKKTSWSRGQVTDGNRNREAVATGGLPNPMTKLSEPLAFDLHAKKSYIPKSNLDSSKSVDRHQSRRDKLKELRLKRWKSDVDVQPSAEPQEKIIPNSTEHKSRVVISKHSETDKSSQDERKFFFDKNSIKVSVKNDFSVPLKSSRTVLAPSIQTEIVPYPSTSKHLPVHQRLGPETNDSRKSLSKFKWFGASQSSTVVSYSKSSLVPATSVTSSTGSGQSENIHAPTLPSRTVIAPGLQNKTVLSALPKPLMTSTPEDLLVTHKASRVPLRIQSIEKLDDKMHSESQQASKCQHERVSSEKQHTPVRTYAKIIRSKYKLHKIGSQKGSPSILPSSSKNIQRRKSLTLVKSRTKLVKKHIAVPDSTTPRPLLKKNTKYKYQVVNKPGSTNSGSKHSGTPRHHKIQLGKQKSSKYRYVRSMSNSSNKSQRNWKSTFSLKRDKDMAMLVYLSKLLGRPVENVSKNKYKFVSAASSSKRKNSREISLKGKKRLPSKSKLKLDRRKLAGQAEAPERYVVINGFVYRSSARKLEKAPTSSATPGRRKTVIIKRMNHAKMKTVTVNGVKFRMDQSGKTLQRIDSTQDTASTSSSWSNQGSGRPITRLDIGGVTYYQSRPGTLVRATDLRQRIAASHVVHRSKSWAYASKQRQTKRQYCLYYQRFGRCNRGDRCPSIHDPEKVAVCKRFLRGTCKITDCPFSHKLSKEKMPVCSYFLRGICTRENCPYLHVKVNQDAETCRAFLSGYCPLGDKCKKKHSLVCQSFMRTGKCSAGKSCKLVHPMMRKRKRSSTTHQRPAKRRALATEGLHSDKAATSTMRVCPSVSQKLEAMPAFIALEPDKEDVVVPVQPKSNPDKPKLQIRPNFT